MGRNLIELYGLLEELKLELDNSFTIEEEEYTRVRIIDIKQMIYELEFRRT